MFSGSKAVFCTSDTNDFNCLSCVLVSIRIKNHIGYMFPCGCTSPILSRIERFHLPNNPKFYNPSFLKGSAA
jgi:hypothetical protein